MENNGVQKVAFNIYADSPEEAQLMQQAICDFIGFFGQRGKKVSAQKVTNALNHWQDNAIVRNYILNYF